MQQSLKRRLFFLIFSRVVSPSSTQRACTSSCYAHRSINVSPDEQLITFFVYRADAGHDYGTIETKGYRKLLVERDGQPAIIDNPNWK